MSSVRRQMDFHLAGWVRSEDKGVQRRVQHHNRFVKSSIAVLLRARRSKVSCSITATTIIHQLELSQLIVRMEHGGMA